MGLTEKSASIDHEVSSSGDGGSEPIERHRFIRWARSRSLSWIRFGLGCCSLETAQAAEHYDDLERLGLIRAASPAQADLLIVSGIVSNKLAPVLRRVYDQMPRPRYVIAVGACATGGGCFHDSYSVVSSCERVVPVDVFVPGCPPGYDALLAGLVCLQEKIAHAGLDGKN